MAASGSPTAPTYGINGYYDGFFFFKADSEMKDSGYRAT